MSTVPWKQEKKFLLANWKDWRFDLLQQNQFPEADATNTFNMTFKPPTTENPNWTLELPTKYGSFFFEILHLYISVETLKCRKQLFKDTAEKDRLQMFTLQFHGKNIQNGKEGDFEFYVHLQKKSDYPSLIEVLMELPCLQ